MGGRLLRCLFAIALLILAPQARAADFYRGRTIDLYIGFGVGGSYDLYARLVAQHLGKHIPGEPTIVPRSMPGAGGLTAANYMYAVASKEGTALAVTSQTIGVDQLFKVSGVAYDALKFLWVGRITSSQSYFFTWHTSPTKNFADALTRETTMGSSGSGDTTDAPRALNRLAGAKFKLVLGYRGSGDVLLAVERGEIEGGYALWSDFKFRKADWLKDRLVNPIFVLAAEPVPDLPGVPSADTLLPTEEGKQIMRVFASPNLIGRAVFTTPGVPEDRLALLRRGFDAMLVDPEFRADAARIGLELDPLTGEELQAKVRTMMATPPDLIAKADEARRP